MPETYTHTIKHEELLEDKLAKILKSGKLDEFEKQTEQYADFTIEELDRYISLCNDNLAKGRPNSARSLILFPEEMCKTEEVRLQLFYLIKDNIREQRGLDNLEFELGEYQVDRRKIDQITKKGLKIRDLGRGIDIVQEINLVRSYLGQSYRGDPFTYQEFQEAMLLIIKQNEELECNPNKCLRHTETECTNLLKKTPEERGTKFLEAIHERKLWKGDDRPCQATYNKFKSMLNKGAFPEESVEIWKNLLIQFQKENHILDARYTASGYLLKSLAGERLGDDEQTIAMELLAKPNEELISLGLAYNHTYNRKKDQINLVTETTPEERCRAFIDGNRLNFQNNDICNPHRATYFYIAAKVYAPQFFPEETVPVWNKVLNQYAKENNLPNWNDALNKQTTWEKVKGIFKK
jgi:hypothetical protein